MLQLIAVTLSLLLLAGMFGGDSESDGNNSNGPTEELPADAARSDIDDSL